MSLPQYTPSTEVTVPHMHSLPSPFRYDTGVISGALPYIRDEILEPHYGSSAEDMALIQEWIVSIAILGAGVG
jgi:hypothetical protein